jgi:hypothetical protein
MPVERWQHTAGIRRTEAVRAADEPSRTLRIGQFAPESLPDAHRLSSEEDATVLIV